MRKILVFLLALICLNVFSQNIREGKSSYGTVLYNFDGKYLRQGKSSYGTVLYNFDGIIPKAITLMICL